MRPLRGRRRGRRFPGVSPELETLAILYVPSGNGAWPPNQGGEDRDTLFSEQMGERHT